MRVKLYYGTCTAVGVSPRKSVREDFATFGKDDVRQKDAEGSSTCSPADEGQALIDLRALGMSSYRTRYSKFKRD